MTQRIAYVTGGMGGIGTSICQRLSKKGHLVIAGCGPNSPRRDRWLGEQKDLGYNFIASEGNVSDWASTVAAFDKVKAEVGRVDILVNNAGITRDNLLMRMTEEAWDEVIGINLKSCFNTVKAVTRTMMKAKSGSIINITSVVGIKGNAGQANYAASKAGIIGFTKSIALELGSRNIRSNAVAPGFIETEMTAVLDEKTVQGWRDGIPMKRGGQPEEVANACVFLGSDLSSYISGQVIQVDGAMLT